MLAYETELYQTPYVLKTRVVLSIETICHVVYVYNSILREILQIQSDSEVSMMRINNKKMIAHQAINPGKTCKSASVYKAPIKVNVLQYIYISGYQNL